MNNLSENKAFNVFHTNIFSLQAKFGILQIVINNLDHQSSIVAMSETCTLQDNNSLFRPQNFDGYQPYYEKQENALKGGCGFYIKKG